MPTLNQLKEETILSLIDSNYIYAYNEIIAVDKQVIKRDLAYVPLKIYAELFFFDYQFDDKAEVVELSQGSRIIKIDVNSNLASINGERIVLSGDIIQYKDAFYVVGEDAALFFKRYVYTGDNYILFSRLDVRNTDKSKVILEYVKNLSEVGIPGEATYIFVSPDGDDKNNGSIEKPYKSLEKAKTVVREMVDDAKGDIIIYLRGGDYFLDKTLTFNEKDSGKNFNKVIYKAYKDEVPVINGGQDITGWELWQDGIYRTEIEKGWSFEMLTENNVRGNLARYPNNGYNRVVGRPGNEFKSSFIFKEEIPNIENLNELRVYVWPGGSTGEWNWFTNDITVKDIDYDNKIVNLSQEASYDLGTGSRYYLKGSKELLDEAGEFYVDKGEGYLYYKPMNLPIKNQKIVASKAGNLVEFVTTNILGYVRNIVFEDIEFTTAERSGIFMDRASNIEIVSCLIHNVGGHGVNINGTSKNNTIKNCEISNFGNTGVMLSGNNISRKDVNRGHLIFNNHIYNGGLMVGGGAGVSIEASGDNAVMHNQIHDLPRYGINFTAQRPGTLIGNVIDKEVITRENVRDFLHTKNNIVQYNRMYDLNNDSQDSGAIASWGAGDVDKSKSNVIAHNWIHDFEVMFSFGHGIYLDDASDGFDVAFNILNKVNYNGGGRVNGIIMAKGIENEIKNNITADAKNSGASLLTQEMAGDYNYNVTSINNIFYEYGDQFYNTYGDFPDNKFKASDYNVFFKESGSYTIGGAPKMNNLADWRNFLGGKYDQNTITEDPMFINSANADYRLQYNSPAYSLGFRDINYGEIGLLQDFKYVKDEDLVNLFFKADGHEIIGSAITLESGESIEISMFGRTKTCAFYANLQNAKISYSVDNDNIKVNDHIITGKKAGVSKLTASVKYNNRVMKSVLYILTDETMTSVKARIDYTKSNLPKALAIGGAAQIKPVVATQNRQFAVDYELQTKCSYKALNGFATADEMGTLTGVSEGVAKIEITAERDGVVKSCIIEVPVKPQELKKIDFLSLRHGMMVGETQNVEVEGIMSDGSKADLSKAEIEYAISDTLFNENGSIITALKSGKTDIIANVTLNGVRQSIRKSLTIVDKARISSEIILAKDAYKTTDYIRIKNDCFENVTERGYGVFTSIDFGSGQNKMDINYSAGNPEGGTGTMYIRLDNEEGPIIGMLYCSGTGGYGKFKTESVKLLEEVSGLHDVYVRFSKSNICDFKSVRFYSTDK